MPLKLRSGRQPAAKRQPAARAKASARVPRLNAATALNTLLEIMTGSDKDAARVSAAKIILARVTALEDKKMRRPKSTPPIPSAQQEQHKTALDAIAQLLDELAAAKSAGLASAARLDQDGAAEPADPKR